jgi:hypothetical protein
MSSSLHLSYMVQAHPFSSHPLLFLWSSGTGSWHTGNTRVTAHSKLTKHFLNGKSILSIHQVIFEHRIIFRRRNKIINRYITIDDRYIFFWMEVKAIESKDNINLHFGTVYYHKQVNNSNKKGFLHQEKLLKWGKSMKWYKV